MAEISIRRLRGAVRERHARAALARLAAGKLSVAAFARREGVSPITVARWSREFGQRPSRGEPPGFIEVRIDRPAAQMAFELDLAGGRRLRIAPGFDAAELARLLEVLAGKAC